MVRCGVFFCGGCNPLIDRKELLRSLMERLPDWEFLLLSPDAPQDGELHLIINGCHAGCIRPRKTKTPFLVVSGLLVQHRQVPESELYQHICAELQRLVKEKYHEELGR